MSPPTSSDLSRAERARLQFRVLARPGDDPLPEVDVREMPRDSRGQPAPFFPPDERDLGVWPLRKFFYAVLEKTYGHLYRRCQEAERHGNRPLRVLRFSSKITQGGVAKVCLQTVLAMDPEKVQTTLVVFDEKPRHVRELNEKLNLRINETRRVIAPKGKAKRFYRDVYRLVPLIVDSQPDIIHVHEPQFVLSLRVAIGKASLQGVCPRLIVQLHNDYRERTSSLPTNLLNPIRKALRESTLIACSGTIEEAARDWLGPGSVDITRIEDGVDDISVGESDLQLPRVLKEAAGGRMILACMAHLAPHKRIEDFILACRALLDEGIPVFCLLMGYGKAGKQRTMRNYFRLKIAPGEGEFLYRVRHPASLLPHVAIGVSPSSLEGLGLNVLEYQVKGIPVVCTDIQPHREMVEHGKSGMTYPVGDVAALTETLKELIEDESLRQRIGKAGFEAAHGRKWEKTARETVELYQRVGGAAD